ncbi:MAG: efflux RND transporter periplasmic adaptor subunit [Bacteroidota bacterium]
MKKLICVSGTLLALSCSSPSNDKKPGFVLEVKTVEATTRNLPVYSEFIGQTFGLSDIDVVSRVEGWVTAIHFKEGQVVQQGQLLYTIDDTPLRNQEDAAASQLASQEVLLTKTKSDLDRVEPLASMNALSKRDLDAARAAYQSQQNAVEAARAYYRNAQLQTSYCRITAPISGIIGITNVQVGDMVSRSIGAKPLNTISSTGNIRVRFSISETDMIRFQQELVRKGEKATDIAAELYLSDGTLYPNTARIDFADRSVDPKTGSLLVQALVKNDLAMPLRPGQFIKIRLKSSELDNAVIIPQQAVKQLQTVFQVFVVDKDDTLRPVPVKPGARIGSNWVIESGINSGDRVAVVGSMLVKPNSLVKPVPMSWSYDSTLVQ